MRTCQPLLLLTLLLTTPLRAVDVDAASTIRYLLSHQKPNGAFGPKDQSHTDLAWNYPAVHALTLLRQPIPRPDDAFTHGRDAAYRWEKSHHKTFSWDLYQRAHLAQVLARPSGPEYDFAARWTLEYFDRAGWYYARILPAKLKARVAHFYNVDSLFHYVSATAASGGTIANPDLAHSFLAIRQCSSGGFEDAYKPDAPRDESAAHVITTASAILTLRALNLDIPNRDGATRFLQSCQTDDGGFRWSPTNDAHSNKPDVWYTQMAVLALKELNAKPRDPDKCLAWLNSLQNADGGFGDRPGWASRLYSTYYAVHALAALTGDPASAIRRKDLTETITPIPENTYQIFQAHLKGPSGAGEMVDAAAQRKFNLLGVKTNTPNGSKATVEEARAYAKDKGHAIELIANPENYAHKLHWLGGHPGHHGSNWLIPPDLTPDQRARWNAADAAGKQALPWPQFKEQVIRPTLEIGTLFYPELDYEMTNAYMVHDDGLDGRPGYNAIVAGLGYTPWDWFRMFPYRERWAGRLPVIVDGDAHGPLDKNLERLDRQRLLYLAKSHTLPDFLDACRHGRTVCVIRAADDRSDLILYGTPAATAYARKHLAQWKWWRNANDK